MVTVFKAVKDRAVSSLAGAMLAGDVSLTLNAGGGALFPIASPFTNFWVTIDNEQLLVGGINSGLVAITGATNGSPIQITAAGHGLNTNDTCTVAGVGGNTAANGVWTVTKVDANNFSLNGSTGNGAYTSGGTVTGDILNTLTRGQNGTAAAGHALNAAVELRIVAQTIKDLTAAINNEQNGLDIFSANQNIAAAGTAILANSRKVKVTNTTAGSLTLTATPTIAAGTDGQTLEVVNIGTQNIVLQDRGTLVGSLLALTATAVTLAPRASIRFTYSSDASLWLETGFIQPL